MALPRTESQIDAAKRAQTARLGQSGAFGKRKRCKKGKSCGASCINNSKFCLVDLPWTSSGGLSKLSKSINSRNKKTSTEELKSKALSRLNKMKEAALAGDGRSYEFNRIKVLEYKKELANRGAIDSKIDVPLPKWSQVEPVIKELNDAIKKKDEATAKLKELFSGKPETAKPSPAPIIPAPTVSPAPKPKPAPAPKPKPKSESGVKLDKLLTTSDFADKISQTQGFYNEKIKAMHTWMEKLLGKAVLPYFMSPNYSGSAEEKFFEKLRNRLFKGFAGGLPEVKEAYSALSLFTGNTYREIRDVQKGRSNNPKYKRMAEVLEKLLARPEADKPEVEKFRGYAVTPASLKGMIKSAEQNGYFNGQALASWSTQLRTSQNFADKVSGNRDQRVVLRAVNKAGVPIGSVSSISHEKEILTPGTAKYKYVSYKPIVYDGWTYHVFDVEEF